MRTFSALAHAALAVAVLVAIALMLGGCIIAPPPGPYGHEAAYPYRAWRAY